MAGAAVCSCSASLAHGEIGNSPANSRWHCGKSTCRSTCHKSGGTMVRTCRWKEQSTRQFGCGRSCRKEEKKGFPDARQLQVKAGFEEILHNQVIISSSTASILGQLTKPISAFLRGKGFNWRLIYKSGGMPSSHSAAVTAATTAIGLERGLSDSMFGLSFILACLVMYDAQGVRRSVGKQSEVINLMVVTGMAQSVLPRSAPRVRYNPSPSPYAIGVELARDPVQAELAFMEEADTSTSESAKGTVVLSKESFEKVNGSLRVPKTFAEERTQANGGVTGAERWLKSANNLPSIKEGEVTLQEVGSSDAWRHIPLKESVGHTKLEVLVGGIWGIVIALALHWSIQ